MKVHHLLVVLLLPSVHGYCAGLGANPGFRGPPRVEQVTLTSVRVTWTGLVTRGECADQFIVKSWLARNPNDYKMSDLLPTTQFSFIVRDLVPNQDYVFQAIAREDKGILGKDWNKSDKTFFRTASYNPTVPPEEIAKSIGPSSVVNPEIAERKPVSVFMLVGIVIASLLGALIVFGAVWNFIKIKRRNKAGEQSDESEESDTDSMELDLQNTDLENRLEETSSRPASRARSYRSRRRSPVSVRTARTWSPSPPSSLVDDSDRV